VAVLLFSVLAVLVVVVAVSPLLVAMGARSGKGLTL
jgi:hypothetical protein